MNISSFKILFIIFEKILIAMLDLIENSVTRQFKAIFPCMLNANNTLFGGEALKWMDEVAFITATRFAHEHMFTVNTEKIKFLKTIKPDTIIEIVGRIEKVKLIRIHVKVEIYAEEMYGSNREKVVEGTFVFVALDENQEPKQLDCLRSMNP
ncbi:MAG: acyl-CoA thioesterase [Bacteroidales bacterium]|nr:acyl-CoA thioesterase [Bacteroidales bacterium]MBN2764528.1 acyl-CoA thioesterase [Bacteroidales bacterium]